MIIKELKIDSFGGVENKIIHLSKGLNLVYGENEAGKSTIEIFTLQGRCNKGRAYT